MLDGVDGMASAEDYIYDYGIGPVDSARRSSAEHMIATKALLHSYGLDAHCR